ncbi:MAG: hypothetical protein Q7U83_18060, partial [Daejeonella sp.]|nr:hypothetical protein [Daejeonella sp.]
QQIKTDINKQMKKVIITFAIAAVSLLSTKSFAQTANLNITISDVLSFSVTQPASLDVNFDTETNSTNKFNISYLIGAGGAYAGKATGLNVVPVVYTVTQQ